ncbi:MAG: diguanylate cyclase [Chloroflexi bacterium]|nr:diguanylate cyclase [Chloroflexota bacterium]
MRVLIAEDSSMGRLLLQRTIERMGHECLTATDGIEAWSLFEREIPDVVISDWLMPGMEGPELCRRVRERPNTPYAYFVFLTALGDRQHAVTGVRAGADDYLTKPLDPHELQVCLIVAERVVGLHRQLAQQAAELEQANRELYETARTDALTRVGNRLRLEEDLRALQARADRYGHRYCLALCDLDRFKEYNDRYGHPSGDAALREIASLFVRQCRSGDSIYRYGGEEFIVIMPELSLAEAGGVLDRVRSAVHAAAIPHASNGQHGIVTVSAGVAASDLSDRTGRGILARADAALYRAKTEGRDRVCLDEPIPATVC